MVWTAMFGRGGKAEIDARRVANVPQGTQLVCEQVPGGHFRLKLVAPPTAILGPDGNPARM